MPRSLASRRGFAVRVTTLLVALGALPLMAPSCGDTSENYKVFARKSLIIPMDVCYQCTLENGLNTTTASCTRTNYATPVGTATNRYQGRACPQTLDKGDVMKAYGLAYQLIRNKVAVYWIIEPNKDKLDDYDLTVQYDGGSPVLLYDWNTGGQGAPPTTTPNHLINYMGGAFVVDGSDYDRASAILQRYKSSFADRLDGTPGVNVHVSNVAFRGYAKKTMAGGWDAGGTVPPKLALLDIGSGNLNSTATAVSSAKNSEPVIQGYLTKAGIGSGTAGGTATGTHGEIYDRLTIEDLQPSTPGVDPTTSRLFTNGYAILWIPHWVAPGSCSDYSSNTSCFNSKYPDAVIDQALRTIGAFVGTGKDLFAECAGLGSLEGAFRRGSTSLYTVDYAQGATDGSTRFQTPSGVRYNELPNNPFPSPDFDSTSLSSPLLQVGDFPFVAFTGAIEDYRPQNPGTYRTSPNVARLIKANDGASNTSYGDPYGAWDFFTYRPAAGGSGTTVYLAGHSYSGVQGPFQAAGSRLVLNTLFNLGATCTASGVACSTGLPGVCSAGTFVCQSGQPVCVANVQPGARAEICNGLDDNCNGEVDEALQSECYEPPPGYVDPEGRSTTDFFASRNEGLCRPGVSSCQRNPDGSYAMSACVGQVLPVTESCDGLDDDCDTLVDEGLTQACYDGPAYSLDGSGNPMGECRLGEQTCQNGSWGTCTGEVLPTFEPCEAGSALDRNCDGALPTCACTDGQSQTCFSGPGTPGVGTCLSGTRTCSSSAWGIECDGEVVAQLTPEPCVASSTYVSSSDTNCDGQTAQCPECTTGAVDNTCYGGTPTHAGVGQCKLGSRTCVAGKWGPCENWVPPSAIEYCDGVDNTCDGPIDESAVCPTRFTCLNGVCVPDACGVEVPPPEGYGCNPVGDPNGVVIPAACGSTPSPGCGTGSLCQYGSCVDPCPAVTDPVTLTSVSLVCGVGTVCGGGACIGGGCYETGCAAGQLCLDSTCVADPCSGVQCPSGTFCRPSDNPQGRDCVQACTFVSCAAGQKCGIDGFCEADPCAGKTCSPGQRCTGGTCAADPCLGKGCARGQVCQVSGTQPVCVDDPCTGVVCAVGVCSGGQCFASGNLTGAGRAAPEEAGSSGCGCGSGGAATLPALLALVAAPLFRRRRRPGGGGHGRDRGGMALLVVVALALVASACKKTEKEEFDPALCQQTCGEQRCVELARDPGHCGACETVCGSGEQCVDAHCGPASAVAPYIQSVSPASGTKDDPAVSVAIFGERFQAGATVRMTTPLGPRTVSCPSTAGGDCHWVSANRIDVVLDLSGAPRGIPWKLRVVNPDLVISNAVSFGVTVPIPTISALVPDEVVAGTTQTVVVQGEGFTGGSQCRLTATGFQEVGLPTVLAAPTLNCVVDASALLPGSYQLRVLSEDLVSSNSATLTVVPSDPVVLSVSPNTGAASTIVSLLSVTGSRFDLSSRVLFDDAPIPQATVFSDTTHLFVNDLILPATGGYHTVSVRNGTGPTAKTSNSVAFMIGVPAAQIAGFSPSTTYQGETSVTLTFTGSGFPADSIIELEPAGASSFTPLASTTSGCAATCTSVSATRSFVGAAEGSWYARIRLGSAPTAPTSAPWPLRVLSNQAILRGYVATPDPQQAGTVGTTKSGLTFQVSNIRGPDFSQVKVVFWDPSHAVSTHLDPTDPTTTTVTTLTVPGPTALSLVGRESGTYSFTIQNPNATESNALPFAVNPGAPTLASVCTTVGCAASATQSDTPISVRLTGDNFARPDVNGNGSTVMVAADFMPGWPAPDPCVANTSVTSTQFEPAPVTTMVVVSPTEIQATIDTRAAYAAPGGTTYAVSVWNPGGAAGPQKSGCGLTATSLPGFTILP
jgi:uncharacterized protein (TIGR03382 family)